MNINLYKPCRIKRALLDLAARFAIGIGRYFTSRKDDAWFANRIGKIAGVAERFGADETLVLNLREAAQIFERGKPGSDIAREMLKEGDPDRLRKVIRAPLLYS